MILLLLLLAPLVVCCCSCGPVVGGLCMQRGCGRGRDLGVVVRQGSSCMGWRDAWVCAGGRLLWLLLLGGSSSCSFRVQLCPALLLAPDRLLALLLPAHRFQETR